MAIGRNARALQSKQFPGAPGGLAVETERRGVVRGVEDDERALDKLSFPVDQAVHCPMRQSGRNSTWPAHSSASLAAQMSSRLSRMADTGVRWWASSKPFIGSPTARRGEPASLMVLTSWETKSS